MQQLPQKEFPFQFSLVDSPVATAFALPGGWIYVSRKLVAASRSDDELAGVLAHEVAHVASHQTAALWTRAFQQVLGVTEIGDDRDEIVDQYHRLVDDAAAAATSRRR